MIDGNDGCHIRKPIRLSRAICGACLASRAGWFQPTQRCVTATTLPAVREKMRESFGMNLYKMPRDRTDDPCIVEVWV